MIRHPFFAFSLCVVLLLGCKTKQPVFEREVLGTVIEEAKRPKNIILMIGDGMGMGQITAGTYMNNNTSNLERFSVVGLHKPYAADNVITDSAAAATAFACGVKTHNLAIGVDLSLIHI